MATPKRDINSIKISDLEKVMKDKNFLEAARKMNPDLANMSDEDFQKVAEGLNHRLGQFKNKYGDMNQAEVLEMGMQQRMKTSEPPKMVSDVKLNDFMATLKPLHDQDKLTFSDHLNAGDSVVVADVIGQTEKKVFFFKKTEDLVGIRYVFRVNGNKLYVYSMKDAKEDELVLTLGYVVPMTPNAFNMLYDQHITKKDRYYTCSEDLLNRAHYRVCINNTFMDMDERADAVIDKSFKENPDSLLVFETVPELK